MNDVPSSSSLGEIDVPSDNLQSEEKIAFGRKLFFDVRLSSDGTVSCATCHMPSLAFTDGLQVSSGVKQHHSERNAPSLLNAGYLDKVMFDAEIPSLEMQVLVPLQDTNEMGMLIPDLIKRLAAIDEYQYTAQRIFKRDIDSYVITRSLAAFERSLISDNSQFDKAERGERKRSKAEQRGWKLFSEKLYCTKCHPAPHFTTFVAENNGLYMDYGEDKGRFRINSDTSEIGFFKIPSLRNIELTAPYMHDGSMNSLGIVLDHYQKGAERSVGQNTVIQPFNLTKTEKFDLIIFLESLTDTAYLKRFME